MFRRRARCRDPIAVDSSALTEPKVVGGGQTLLVYRALLRRAPRPLLFQTTLLRDDSSRPRLESRIALEELRARYPRYRVDERGLRRVHMSNVAGFSHVAVAVDGRA